MHSAERTVQSARWRTAIKGAARWLKCRRAAAAERKRRATVCRGCADLVIYRIPGVGHCFGTCGKHLEETESTCGCLVLTASAKEMRKAGGKLQTEGKEGTRAVFRLAARPTGKTRCAGERCPRGKW